MNSPDSRSGPLLPEREAGLILLPVCFLLPGPVLNFLFPAWSAALKSTAASFTVLLCAFFIFRKGLYARFKIKKEEQQGIKQLAGPFFKCAGIYLLCLTAVGLIINCVNPGMNPNDISIRSMLNENVPVFAIALLITGPLSEEIFFRYFVFTSLRKHGIIVSISLTFLVFATLHLIPYLSSVPFADILLYALQYLPASVSLCLLYERTDSVCCVVLAHALINVFALIYCLLAV